MRPININPKYKLLLTYDIRPEHEERYYRYVMGEFVPEVQRLGLYMHRAWGVVYGDYPMRLIEFVTERDSIVDEVLNTERWRKLEDDLKRYIENYERKLVRYQPGFQM